MGKQEICTGKFTLKVDSGQISWCEGEQHHFTTWRNDVLFEAIKELLKLLKKKGHVKTKCKKGEKKENGN